MRGGRLLYRGGSPLWSSWSLSTDFYVGRSPQCRVSEHEQSKKRVYTGRQAVQNIGARVGQHRARYKSLSSVKRHFARGNQPGIGLDPSRARKVSEWGTRGRGY